MHITFGRRKREEAPGMPNLKIFRQIPTVRKHFAISLWCSMARVQLTARASQQLNITQTQKWRLVPKLHNIFS